MIWNLEVGGCYAFHLYGGDKYTGRIELIDNDGTIVIWSKKLGEMEIKSTDCRFIEPSFDLKEILKL